MTQEEYDYLMRDDNTVQWFYHNSDPNSEHEKCISYRGFKSSLLGNIEENEKYFLSRNQSRKLLNFLRNEKE